MASDLEKKAKEAFFDDHVELALELYSQAIAIDPNNADLFADRAQANIKLKNFTEAVADADRAIQLDPSMSQAYLRKGNACMKLGEYQTAKAALEAGANLAPGVSRFINLIKECDERIAEEIGSLPNKALEKDATHVASPEDFHQENALTNYVVVAPTKPKYRHEFYQKPEEVVVTIFAKKVPPVSVNIDYGEQILSVHIEIPGEDAYDFQPRLFGKIIPDKCRFEVLSTKIEIHLAKAEPLHWSSLEFTNESTVVRKVDQSSVAGSQRPTYPSSMPKQTDWDKLEAEVKKEEKEEKLDGDAALNKFFRDLYSDSDDDTRRAMRKSFVESNGTVLSTNWNEVGTKMVEGSPPDGMEMRKWEY